VFVLPSLTEGIPLALLEAMAARLPVVATAVGGVPEVVVHGESGILVPPGDSAALGDALTALLAQPERRARLAEQAQRRVGERFGLEAMARAYRRLYFAEPPERRWKRAGKAMLRRLPRRWLLWRGNGARAEIALTFDDGPDPRFTPQILDLLRRYGVRATFFVVGERALAHPSLVRRIVAEGHEIGSHSHTHPDFARLSWREARAEIAGARAAIEQLQGGPCRLFRPPRGKLCWQSLAGAWRDGLTVVMWSVDLKDFRAETPAAILDFLAARPLRAGDVVLYHETNAAALAALPGLIEAALAESRRAVPVSRLIGS
jgi:peptidoglycan/xylan/chitin deacetylase (PgdA/CDA1 family)